MIMAVGACVDQTDDHIGETSQAAIVGDVDNVPGCTGAWNYVDSFDGFIGTYARFDVPPVGEMTRLTVVNVNTEPQTIFVNGFYQRAVRDGVWVQQQAGMYVAVPANPAIGSVIVFNDVTGEDFVDGYVIVGERRNPFTAKIAQLCLAKFDATSDNGVATPFVLNRWL